MGIYLNPKNTLFKRDLRSEIYVDKSSMLVELNKIIDTNGNYICISRPRRFGKTMMVSMMTAYYSKGCDSRELFAPLKIAQDASFQQKLNKFNVIRLDMNMFYMNLTAEERPLLFKKITLAVNKELADAFPDAKIDVEGSSLGNALLKAWDSSDETFILLFDEYDVLVREQVPASLFNDYLNFLSSLFKNSTFRQAISLAYLTGILPIVRDKIQSKMNEFFEYSMVSPEPFSEFIGFTEPETKALCEKTCPRRERCCPRP